MGSVKPVNIGRKPIVVKMIGKYIQVVLVGMDANQNYSGSFHSLPGEEICKTFRATPVGVFTCAVVVFERHCAQS